MWCTTDLVFAQRFAGGFPTYGPVVIVTSAPVLLLVLLTTTVAASRMTVRSERGSRRTPH